MFALERQKKIIELLTENGGVWVSELSKSLGVTEETIRRDLEKLERQELLLRTHGGAVPIDESTYELSLERRKRTNVDVKEMLAKEAVKYIAPGDTIFLDASTTTFYLSKELKNLSNITVITNSLRVINELAGQDSLKVIAVGGIVSGNMSLIGSLAEIDIQQNYVASKIFFSSKGVTLESGILESNDQECGIKQKMIANAKKKFYLCDRTKIGRVGYVKLAGLEEIDTFITEADLDERWTDKFNDLKIEAVKVKV